MPAARVYTQYILFIPSPSLRLFSHAARMLCFPPVPCAVWTDLTTHSLTHSLTHPAALSAIGKKKKHSYFLQPEFLVFTSSVSRFVLIPTVLCGEMGATLAQPLTHSLTLAFSLSLSRQLEKHLYVRLTFHHTFPPRSVRRGKPQLITHR